MGNTRLAHSILRIGVALPFLYAPVDALLDPYSWIDFFPHFMRGIVPDPILLNSFGLLEVAIALWILSGKKIVIPSLIAALLLVAIVVFNLSEFQLLFRDLSIAAAALALACMNLPRSRRTPRP